MHWTGLTLCVCVRSRSLHHGGSLSSTPASREDRTWWNMLRSEWPKKKFCAVSYIANMKTLIHLFLLCLHITMITNKHKNRNHHGIHFTLSFQPSSDNISCRLQLTILRPHTFLYWLPVRLLRLLQACFYPTRGRSRCFPERLSPPGPLRPCEITPP